MLEVQNICVSNICYLLPILCFWYVPYAQAEMSNSSIPSVPTAGGPPCFQGAKERKDIRLSIPSADTVHALISRGTNLATEYWCFPVSWLHKF